MIGLEQQNAPVRACCIIELADAFVLGRFEKELVDLIASGIGAASTGRRAMLERGAALLSVHRP
ncbi:MAG TPA: hypothetical protein VK208_15955 [Pyrinomonadaceae bacterium]|nr:hypothetical protein [Pyrinomonadaceae bacterium]